MIPGFGEAGLSLWTLVKTFFVFLGLLLLIRELTLWYFKINRIVRLLENIQKLLTPASASETETATDGEVDLPEAPPSGFQTMKAFLPAAVVVVVLVVLYLVLRPR